MLRALPALPSFLLEEKKAKETSVIGLCKFYIAFSRGRRGTALAVDEAYYNVGEGYAGLRSNRGRRRRDGWGSPLPNIRLYRYTRQDLSSFSLPLRGRGTATRWKEFIKSPPSVTTSSCQLPLGGSLNGSVNTVGEGSPLPSPRLYRYKMQ